MNSVAAWAVPISLPGRYFSASFAINAESANAAQQDAFALAATLKAYSGGTIFLQVGTPTKL